jgi:small subunit ribosomal protein S20
MRNSTRKAAHNRHQKSGLKTLEKRYTEALAAGKKEEAAQALRVVSSALDKAAKVGTIHWAKAARKKGRLAVRLAVLK